MRATAAKALLCVMELRQTKHVMCKAKKCFNNNLAGPLLVKDSGDAFAFVRDFFCSIPTIWA